MRKIFLFKKVDVSGKEEVVTWFKNLPTIDQLIDYFNINKENYDKVLNLLKMLNSKERFYNDFDCCLYNFEESIEGFPKESPFKPKEEIDF